MAVVLLGRCIELKEHAATCAGDCQRQSTLVFKTSCWFLLDVGLAPIVRSKTPCRLYADLFPMPQGCGGRGLDYWQAQTQRLKSLG
eukprot:3090690-Amphidinium_carterae.1